MTEDQSQMIEKIMEAVRDYGWAERFYGYGHAEYGELAEIRYDGLLKLIAESVCSCRQKEE